MNNIDKQKLVINESQKSDSEIAKSKQKKDSYYRILASKLREKGENIEAVKTYCKAIKLNPQQPSWVYQHLGILLYEQERHEEAFSVYRRAISLYPQDDSYYRVLAKYKRLDGHLDDAIKLYSQAIQLNPQQPIWVYHHLGSIFDQQGQYEKAISIYHNAIKFYPENDVCYKALARVQHQTGEIDKALVSYLAAIKIKPEQPIEFYRNVAKALKNHGELGKAVLVQKRITALNHNLTDKAREYLEEVIIQLTKGHTKSYVKTKLYAIYGNCQARILASFLNSSKLFKSKYKYVSIRPVHLISESEIKDLVENILPEVDLFLYQPVSEKYRGTEYSSFYLLQQLNNYCQSISFPSCYFKGYNPEMKYLKDEQGHMMTDRFDYHDLQVIQGFLESLSIEQVKANIENNSYYAHNFSKSEVEKSLKELEKRENSIFGTDKQIEIKISKFIRDNYQKHRLFHTVNHPSKFVFKYMAEEILKFLNIEDTISQERDFLNHTAYPVYQSHYNNLNFDFINPMNYSIRDSKYDLYTTIKSYFEYYTSLPKKVIENNAFKNN